MCDITSALQLVTLHAIHDMPQGVNISEKLISNLQFADDIVLLTEMAEDLHILVDCVYSRSGTLGMKINITKTDKSSVDTTQIK